MDVPILLKARKETEECRIENEWLKKIVNIKREDLDKVVTINQKLEKSYTRLQLHNYLDKIDGKKNKTKKKIRSDNGDDSELKARFKVVEDENKMLKASKEALVNQLKVEETILEAAVQQKTVWKNVS